MFEIPEIIPEMQKKIAKILKLSKKEVQIYTSPNNRLIKIYLQKSNMRFGENTSYLTEIYKCGNKKVVVRLYLDYNGYEYSKIVEILEDILENLMADYFVALEK